MSGDARSELTTRTLLQAQLLIRQLSDIDMTADDWVEQAVEKNRCCTRQRLRCS